jgi:hypothetical protein
LTRSLFAFTQARAVSRLSAAVFLILIQRLSASHVRVLVPPVRALLLAYQLLGLVVQILRRLRRAPEQVLLNVLRVIVHTMKKWEAASKSQACK